MLRLFFFDLAVNQPQAARRVWIPKTGSTEKRPLGTLTVRDRVVQAAIRPALDVKSDFDAIPHRELLERLKATRGRRVGVPAFPELVRGVQFTTLTVRSTVVSADGAPNG